MTRCPDVLAVTDRRGRIRYVHPGVEQLTGRAPRQLIGRSWLELISAADRSRAKSLLRRALTQKDLAATTMVRVRHQDRSTRWVETVCHNLSAQPGVHGLLFHCRDRTDRVQALHVADRMSRQLHALFDHTLDAILLADDKARYIEVNPAACRLLGYRRAELLTKRVWDVTPVANLRTGRRLWQEFIAAGELQGDYVLLRKNGTTREVEYRAVANILPGVHLSAIRDVTDRKRAERALEEVRQDHARLLNSIDEVAYSVRCSRGDPLRAQVTFVSRQSRSITGYEPREFQQNPALWLSLVHPDDVPGLRAITRRISSERRPLTRVYRLRHRQTGTYLWMEDKVTPEFDRQGRLIGYFGVARDITQRKLAEQRLRGMQDQLRLVSTRLRLLREEEHTRLARELHDQLGQTLAGLHMHARWLERRIGRPRGKRSPLAATAKGLVRLAATALQQTRRIAASLRPAALDRLGLLPAIEALAEMFERRTGIRCRTVWALEGVVLDRERAIEVFRIVQEALTNVERHAGASRATIRATVKDRTLRVEVHDNGRGISKAALTAPGSLGLIGMRERAALAGASLTVAPARPEGTIVRVEVPHVTAEEAP